MTDATLRLRVSEAIEAPPPVGERPAAPRVIETSDTRPIEPAAPPAIAGSVPSLTGPALRNRSGLPILLVGFGVVALGVLAIDLAGWLISQFERGWLLGCLALTVVAIGGAIVAYGVIAEMRALSRMKTVDQVRARIGSATDGLSLDRSIDTIIDALPRSPATLEAVRRYRSEAQPHHAGAQRLALLSRVALAPADTAAIASIRAAALQAATMTALCPKALGDTVLFASRALRLIRQVAGAYGHRPGVVATAHLARRLMAGAGAIGAADLVGDMAVSQLGGAILGVVAEKVSVTAAESLFAAQRMGRLGLLAMAECRPVAFPPGEAPTITSSLRT